MQKTSTPAYIFSIGHSNRPISEFIERLKANNITMLVDVRTKPYSRYCPWFNKSSLASFLAAQGIVYAYHGHNLGGLGENVDYDKTLDELVVLSEFERIAIMCSEADFNKCHRYTMIEPDLINRGVELEHIRYV